MNLYRHFIGEIVGALAGHAGRRRAAGRARLLRHHRRAAARCRAWRHRDQCRHGAGQGRGQEAARHRRAAAGAAEGQSRRGRRRRSPGRASSTSSSPTTSGARACATCLEAGAAYGNSTMGEGREGQCRVRLGQPDRPAACRRTRAARWSAMRSPTCCAKAGYAVTKEYYINDAGAQVDMLGPLDLPALPRGAGRDDRRDPRGPLSRRVPEGRRRGARQARRRALARQARGRLAARMRDFAIADADGRDPDRSRRRSACTSTSSRRSARWSRRAPSIAPSRR